MSDHDLGSFHPEVARVIKRLRCARLQINDFAFSTHGVRVGGGSNSNRAMVLINQAISRVAMMSEETLVRPAVAGAAGGEDKP